METYATRPRAARNHGQTAVERGLGRVAGAPNSALNAMAGEELLRGLPSRERAVPPDLTQALLERFSVPLTGLRVYEDRGLDGIGQAAYAQGNEIHFAEGYYDPLTQRGRDMFFHEAAHVIQQGAGMVPGHGIVENSVLESQANFGFAAPESFSMPATSVGAPIQGWRLWDWNTPSGVKSSAATSSLISSIGALVSAFPKIYDGFAENTNGNKTGNTFKLISRLLGGGANAIGSFFGMSANFSTLDNPAFTEDEQEENALLGIGNLISGISGAVTFLSSMVKDKTVTDIAGGISQIYGFSSGATKSMGSLLKVIDGYRSGNKEKMIDGGVDGTLAVMNMIGNLLMLGLPNPFVGAMVTGSSAAANIIKIIIKKMLSQPEQGPVQPISAA